MQDTLNKKENNAIVLKTPHKTAKNPEYNKEYLFDDFGDFDKYWFSTEPFVYDSFYPDAITTIRAGGNKRLFVTGEEFKNIADFKASLEIIPTAEHTLENGNTAKAETGINTGILFRIGEMKDYTTNVCSFDGYRCFLTVSSGVVKMQLSRYYFKTETAASSTNQVLKTAVTTLPYVAGDTYVIEVTCIGNTVSAKAYNKKAPETVITIDNQSLVTSVADTLDSGKIGIFSNCGSRVAIDNMKVTPYYSSASLNCDLGNLNALSTFDIIKTSSNAVSIKQGLINIPIGVTKLLVKDEKAKNVSNFNAKTRIKITNTTAVVQAGFAFRVSDAVAVSPGMTGYAIVLQRTSSHTPNQIVVGITKYGTNKNGATNVNLGNQSYKDTVLLADKNDKSEVVGTEFDFDVTVLNNKMSVTVTRVDNPEITVTYDWIIDNKDYSMNKSYPVYYESGRIGFFSNGVVQVSDTAINLIHEEYDINTNSNNGNIILSTDKTEVGDKVYATVLADDGYFINKGKLYAVLANGTTVNLETENSYWDTLQVLSLKLPKGAVTVNCEFEKINSGDSNGDGEIDVRDLVNIKNYIAGKTDSIVLSNADFDGNKKLSSEDIVSSMKQLLNN